MSIYLQTTPSLRKKRMTKASRKLLSEHNEERRKQGLAPLENLKFQKLVHDKVRSERNMPNYSYTPRHDATKNIPSSTSIGKQNATARRSIMEKVTTGEISGKDAEEVVRKSKCLAPAYNKGAVQYVGDSDAARDAGKKV